MLFSGKTFEVNFAINGIITKFSAIYVYLLAFFTQFLVGSSVDFY